ncbi:alpha/beta fold hydrolase [Comamonas sp. CMM02]|uniref:alpha/beta fold hydrolase n=1 Tax=Comamonas sp. CMM02 TaxID=2769307 RepID=UPI001784D4EC|nr:alpha/beta hydrolase [Comamonas sp. CMM02]MBD9401778.1 alpha/beta hydrolase [Comamonas sp. CMM02]
MQPLIFSHANSFPAGTYRLLFALLRERGFDVHALDRFGHDARYPVTSNWPHLVQQLADFATPLVQRWGQPALMVGHSLGGFVSVMTAAQHPHLARGVLMLDSPLISGWRATSLEVAKRTQLVGNVSPGKISRKRRNIWPSRAEALTLFQSKKAFARWHPQVLQDYVDHGLDANADGHVTLHFSREEETAIYNNLPHNLNALLRRHPLRCPVAFISGMYSKEMKQVGMDMTLRITHGRTMLVDGGHLFPMEQPHVTAAAIEASLLNLDVAAAKL